MFMAAFIALFQTNTKRILAYSSISQMGYILMGTGCAAYMGLEGPMGFSGTMMHIFNHAFFKAGMFMMVGAVMPGPTAWSWENWAACSGNSR